MLLDECQDDTPLDESQDEMLLDECQDKLSCQWGIPLSAPPLRRAKLVAVHCRLKFVLISSFG